MRTGYVYILECADKSFYTGVTNNIDGRVAEHFESAAGSNVHKRKPLNLVWTSDVLDIQDAMLLEYQIKGRLRFARRSVPS